MNADATGYHLHIQTPTGSLTLPEWRAQLVEAMRSLIPEGFWGYLQINVEQGVPGRVNFYGSIQ